mmetsp:Transcript_72374/g.183107  ORF Transcript_72374/g.183107 Transcript_72374/m.183107 type:complete len:240 (-) Transcript_72374:23-742(-)
MRLQTRQRRRRHVARSRCAGRGLIRFCRGPRGSKCSSAPAANPRGGGLTWCPKDCRCMRPCNCKARRRPVWAGARRNSWRPQRPPKTQAPLWSLRGHRRRRRRPPHLCSRERLAPSAAREPGPTTGSDRLRSQDRLHHRAHRRSTHPRRPHRRSGRLGTTRACAPGPPPVARAGGSTRRARGPGRTGGRRCSRPLRDGATGSPDPDPPPSGGAAAARTWSSAGPWRRGAPGRLPCRATG